MSSDWSDESVRRLKQLWAEKKADPQSKITARTIALELRTSRSAILGKLNRLGLLDPGPPRVRKQTAYERVVTTRPPAPPQDPDPAPQRDGPVPQDPPADVRWPETPGLEREVERQNELLEHQEAASIEPPIDGVTIMELSARTCRWPIGNPADWDRFRFCGAPPAAGSVYCAEHTAIAFTPNKGGRR